MRIAPLRLPHLSPVSNRNDRRMAIGLAHPAPSLQRILLRFMARVQGPEGVPQIDNSTGMVVPGDLGSHVNFPEGAIHRCEPRSICPIFCGPSHTGRLGWDWSSRLPVSHSPLTLPPLASTVRRQKKEKPSMLQAGLDISALAETSVTPYGNPPAAVKALQQI